MTKNTGGPAFPVNGSVFQPGMTLRDWFAGMALGGLYAQGIPDGYDYDDVANKAYRAADAMLKERER